MSDEDSGIKPKNPDTYSGGNKDLERFLSQCQLYFMLKHKNFKTQMEKVLFAGSHLRGPAADWFAPFIRDMSKGDKARQETKLMFHDYKNFEQGLEQLYGSRDKQQLAVRQLGLLKQNGPAPQYTAAFRRIAMDTDFNDSALRHNYYLGLRDSIKDELTRGDKPENLEELIERATSIDERFYERQLERGRGFQTQGQGYYQQRNNGYQGQSRNNGYQGQQRRDHYGSQPMDLSATRGPLSQKDRDHRMKNNLCLYCGKPGHRARECKAKQQHGKLAATHEYDPEDSDDGLPQYLKATHIEEESLEVAPLAITQPLKPTHAWLSRTACYNDDCQVHYSAKIDSGWFPRKPRKNKRHNKKTSPRMNNPNLEPQPEPTSGTEEAFQEEYHNLAATILEQQLDTTTIETEEGYLRPTRVGDSILRWETPDGITHLHLLPTTQEEQNESSQELRDKWLTTRSDKQQSDSGDSTDNKYQIDMDGSYIRIDQQEVMSPNGVITTWEEVDGSTRLYFRTVDQTAIDDLTDNFGTKWLSIGSDEYKEMLKDNAARRSNEQRRSKSLPPRTPSPRDSRLLTEDIYTPTSPLMDNQLKQ